MRKEETVMKVGSADDGDAGQWVASIGETSRWVALVQDGSARWVWEMDCERW